MFRLAVPELVSCTFVVALAVPASWLANGTLVGLNATAGAGKVPTPVRVTD